MPARWVAGVVVLATVALFPGVARADAAAPTDYRTRIESIVPAVDGLEVSVEGGDAFLRLRAPTGHEVVVLGYVGEPYLRFSPDGTVAQNVRSPATYENEERYGASELPAGVDPTADPEWETVATHGVWAWHDHRSHWMEPRPPFGLDAGESLPAQVVPLEVDGRPVAVSVVTTLVPSPSWLPVAIGGLLGLQIAVVAVWLGQAMTTLATLLVSTAALVVGTAQFRSLPAETGPIVTWWLVPAIALICAIATIALYGRSLMIQHGLIALAALQLGIWSFRRRSALDSAVLPTDLPFWVDRAVTAATLVAAVLILIGSLRSLLFAAPEPGA